MSSPLEVNQEEQAQREQQEKPQIEKQLVFRITFNIPMGDVAKAMDTVRHKSFLPVTMELVEEPIQLAEVQAARKELIKKESRKLIGIRRQRAAAANNDISAVKASITADEQRVLSAWNESNYVKSQIAHRTDLRNFPVGDAELKDCLKEIRSCMKKFSVDDLLGAISDYFKMCEGGGHIRPNKNYGFSSLTGMMRKLSTTGARNWWWSNAPQPPIEDPDSVWTGEVIKTFATAFPYDVSVEFVKNPSPEYVLFMKTGQRVKKMVDQDYHRYTDADGLLAVLVSTIQEHVGARRFTPKVLSYRATWSDWLWNALEVLGWSVSPSSESQD